MIYVSMTVIIQLHVTLQHGAPRSVNQTVCACAVRSRAVGSGVPRRRFQIQSFNTSLCSIYLFFYVLT